jgi:hypothetical protein
MKRTIDRGPKPNSSRPGKRVELTRAWGWFVTRRFELAALALYTFILILRAPWVWVFGRFWAEEATVYLSYAWTHPFMDALTSGHLGYYNLVPNLAGIIGAYVPLDQAPRYTVLIALLVQVLPALLVLFSSVPGLTSPARKAAALLLLLVVPANSEVLLTTINCNLLLCVSTALILVSDHGGFMDRAGKCALLALGGLDGVVSTFLTPFFWFVWWKERRRERLEQALILTVCTLIQFIVATRAIASGQRNLRFDLTVLVGTAYAKFVVTPLMPAKAAFQYLDQLARGLTQTGGLPAAAWLLTIIVFVGFLALCWRSGKRAALLLAAASLWVALLSFAASRGTDTEGKLIANINYALRYYYAPQVLFFVAALVCLEEGSRLPRWSQSIAGIWLVAVLVMGCFNYACAPLDWPNLFSGPSWAQQVQQWRKDPSKPLAIWPAGWEVTLPPKP